MEAVAAALSVEYEKVKENLKGVDENIIKLYGRDPNENRLVSSSSIILLSISLDCISCGCVWR